MTPQSDPRVLRLEHVLRQLAAASHELRCLRQELIRDSASRGVLGSRGLTQFILERLAQFPDSCFDIQVLAQAAADAGYAIPSTRLLTKRLSEHGARTGKIEFSRKCGGWRWTGGA